MKDTLYYYSLIMNLLLIARYVYLSLYLCGPLPAPCAI